MWASSISLEELDHHTNIPYGKKILQDSFFMDKRSICTSREFNFCRRMQSTSIILCTYTYKCAYFAGLILTDLQLLTKLQKLEPSKISRFTVIYTGVQLSCFLESPQPHPTPPPPTTTICMVMGRKPFLVATFRY